MLLTHGLMSAPRANMHPLKWLSGSASSFADVPGTTIVEVKVEVEVVVDELAVADCSTSTVSVDSLDLATASCSKCRCSYQSVQL